MNPQWLLDWRDLVQEIERRMLYTDVAEEILDKQYQIANTLKDNTPEFHALYEAAKKRIKIEYDVVYDLVELFHLKEVQYD